MRAREGPRCTSRQGPGARGPPHGPARHARAAAATRLLPAPHPVPAAAAAAAPGTRAVVRVSPPLPLVGTPVSHAVPLLRASFRPLHPHARRAFEGRPPPLFGMLAATH